MPELTIILDSEMRDTNSDNAVELALSLAAKSGGVALEMEDYESESIVQAGKQYYLNRLNKQERNLLGSCLNVDLLGVKHEYPRLSFTGNVHFFGERIEWITNKPPGILPSHFIHLLNEQVDSIWCPSQAAADYLKASGANAGKLMVIPVGVSNTVIEQNKKSFRKTSRGEYKFVAIGTIEKASGIDVVIEAFCEAFKRIANASLEIRILPLKQRDIIQREKSHNRAARLDHVKYVERANALAKYRIGNWKSYVRAKGMGPDRVKFRYLDEGVRVWPSYFKDASCYVQAHRSDLVGQRIMQAMGLGLPVIATARYLPDEIKTRGLNYFIQSKEGSAAEGEWSSDVVYSCWAEPNLDHLIKLLRHVYFNRSEARERGRKASDHILNNLTWSHTAKKVMETMEKMQRRKKDRPRGELSSLFAGLKEKNLINIEEEAYERK